MPGMRAALAVALAAAAVLFSPESAGAEALGTRRALARAGVRATARGVDDVFRALRHHWKGDMIVFFRNVEPEDALLQTLRRGDASDPTARQLARALSDPDATADEVRKARAAHKAVLGKAVAALAEEYHRVEDVFELALTRVARAEDVAEAAGKELATRSGRSAMVREAVARLDAGEAIHPAILDIDRAATVAVNQIEAARRLTGAVPEGFRTIEGLEEVLAALRRRRVLQEEAGRMYTLDSGYFLSLRRARNADVVMARLRQGADEADVLDAVDLRELTLGVKRKVLAAKAAKDPQLAAKLKAEGVVTETTEYQRALMDAYTAGDDARKAAAKGRVKFADDVADDVADDAAGAAGSQAAKALATLRKQWRRADLDAKLAGGDLRLSLGQSVQRASKDLYAPIAARAREATKAGSTVRMGPSTDRLFAALQRKDEVVRAARKANGGTLPSGVQQLTASEAEALAALREFFEGPLKQLRDVSGGFMPRKALEQYERVRRAMLGSADEIEAFFKKEGASLNKFLTENLRYYDSEFERSLRAVLRRAKDRRFSQDVTAAKYIPGSDRVHGTGNMATLQNYNDGPRTIQYVVYDGRTIEDILTAAPKHRSSYTSYADEIPWEAQKVQSTFGYIMTSDQALYETVARRIRGLNTGVADEPLTAEHVRLIRHVLSQNPPTSPQKIVLARMARQNDAVMAQVVDPGSAVAVKWPKRVASSVDTAKKAELEDAARAASKGGRTAEAVLGELDELEKTAKSLRYSMVVRYSQQDGSAYKWLPGTVFKYGVKETIAQTARATGAQSPNMLAVASRELLEQMKKQQAALDELRVLKHGVLPDGVGLANSENKKLIAALEEYFETPRVRRAGTSSFYSSLDVHRIQKLEEDLAAGVYNVNEHAKASSLREQLRKFLTNRGGAKDDELQAGLREAVRKAKRDGKLGSMTESFDVDTFVPPAQ